MVRRGRDSLGNRGYGSLTPYRADDDGSRTKVLFITLKAVYVAAKSHRNLFTRQINLAPRQT